MLTILRQESVSILLANYYRDDNDKCWLWSGTLNSDNYGMIRYTLNGKRIYNTAHRISYMYYNNIEYLDSNICVLHSCDNPSCINPNHLFSGTFNDNSKDMVAKNRQAKGITSGHAKLNEETIRQIRMEYSQGMTQVELCRIYNMNDSRISEIVNYKTWKHITI